MKQDVMKHFNLGHLCNCTLVDSGEKLRADTILTKGMRVYVHTKRINFHQTETNIFSVLVKKEGSNESLEKNFYKSLKKDFNIDKSQLSFFKIENQFDSKAKITFETRADQNYHIILMQKNRLFLNHRRYKIKIIRD